MFYSYDILNPREGKLAVVWLVATGRFKYTRRQDKNFKDVISVKVHSTCDEILRYVLNGETNIKGRFSLYLSSMLMFGTVQVYRRQITYLLDQALEAFESVKRQRTLAMLDLETPVPKKMRVTLKPVTEGLVTTELFHTPGRDLVTPRRRRPDETRRTSDATTLETESDVLRRRSMAEQPDGDLLAMLRTEWVDESPLHVRPQDITMLDDEMMAVSSRMEEEQRTLERSLGPLDLGPCFSTWEGPISELPGLQDIRKSFSLEEADKEIRARDARRADELGVVPLTGPSTSTEPSDAEQAAPPEVLPTIGIEMVVQPPVEETPAHPVQEPQAELVKKGAAPAPAEDQTPVVPAKGPPRELDTSQMELHSLDRRVEPEQRRRRRRRLIVDRETHIPTEVIRAQTRDWNSSKRCKTSQEDTVNAYWFRKIVPAQKLMSQVNHRHPLANPLTRLLTRHYRTDPAQEHWDFPPSVRRQLQLVDESREEARPGISSMSMEISALTEASALQASHEILSSRSFQLTPQTAQLEATVPAAVIQDPTQLLPIEEEQGMEVIPPPEGLEESVRAAEDQQRLEEGAPRLQETPVRSEKPGVKKPHLDEEIHLATPESQRKPERVTSYVPPDDTPTRGPPRSPESGANVVTVQADVHDYFSSDAERTVPPRAAPDQSASVTIAADTQEFEVMPQVPALFEEVDAPVSLPKPTDMPGPHAPPGPSDTDEAFIPSFISPVRRVSPVSHNYLETERKLKALYPRGAKTTFADILPQNAKRLDVVHMYSVLLEMHKKRIVRMEQEGSYATIYIIWL